MGLRNPRYSRNGNLVFCRFEKCFVSEEYVVAKEGFFTILSKKSFEKFIAWTKIKQNWIVCPFQILRIQRVFTENPQHFHSGYLFGCLYSTNNSPLHVSVSCLLHQQFLLFSVFCGSAYEGEQYRSVP
jgi:hypothetical protein